MQEDNLEALEDKRLIATDQWVDEAGNQWSYCVNDDGTCVICGIIPAGSTLEVPEQLEGYRVTALAAEACTNGAALRQLSLPSTLRIIGRRAFSHCAKLETVALNEGLESLGAFAFMSTGLKQLRTPSTLKRIGDKAFFHCTSLAKVQLNEGLEFIGASAFAQTSVSELVIPASVSSIGQHVLQPWHAQDAVRLRVHSGNAAYTSDSAGAALYRREPDGLVLVDYLGSGTRYEVLPGTRVVGSNAFAQHPNLKEVVLPEGLVEIGTGAFRSCSSLAAIDLPSTLETLGARTFINTNLQAITLPASLRAIDNTSLLIHGANNPVKNAPTPLVIRVDAANPQFFVEGGVLCRREEDGGVRALMYAGEERVVRIPENVTRVGSCLFYGVWGIDELFLHDRMGAFSVEAFSAGVPVGTVHLALSEPVDGYSAIDVHFPPTIQARQFFMMAFAEGALRPSPLIEASDQALILFSDQYDMGRAVLERLESPVLVDEGRDRYLRRLLSTRLKSVSQGFARHNYHEGFTRLADQGILTAATIDDAISYAREAGSTATVGYLLELKHTRFSSSPMDEYEL